MAILTLIATSAIILKCGRSRFSYYMMLQQLPYDQGCVDDARELVKRAQILTLQPKFYMDYIYKEHIMQGFSSKVCVEANPKWAMLRAFRSQSGLLWRL